MRKGIKALNQMHNTPETPFRGYNETITQAWVRIVYKRVKNNDYKNSINFLVSEKDILDSNYLEKFYPLKSLKTILAKTTFIVPERRF